MRPRRPPPQPPTPPKPSRPYDPPARVAIQLEFEAKDRDILLRGVRALEKIANTMIQSSGMTPEEKAELRADADAIKAKLDATGVSLDDEVERLKSTGDDPAT